MICWKMVENGFSRKLKYFWDEHEKKMFSLHIKSMHILQSALNDNDYAKISKCHNAKDILSILDSIYLSNQPCEFVECVQKEGSQLESKQSDESLKFKDQTDYPQENHGEKDEPLQEENFRFSKESSNFMPCFIDTKENEEDHILKKKSSVFKASTQLDDMKENGGDEEIFLLPKWHTKFNILKKEKEGEKEVGNLCFMTLEDENKEQEKKEENKVASLCFLALEDQNEKEKEKEAAHFCFMALGDKNEEHEGKKEEEATHFCLMGLENENEEEKKRR